MFTLLPLTEPEKQMAETVQQILAGSLKKTCQTAKFIGKVPCGINGCFKGKLLWSFDVAFKGKYAAWLIIIVFSF